MINVEQAKYMCIHYEKNSTFLLTQELPSFSMQQLKQ